MTTVRIAHARVDVAAHRQWYTAARIVGPMRIDPDGAVFAVLRTAANDTAKRP